MDLLKIKRQNKGITSVQMSRYLGIRKETYKNLINNKIKEILNLNKKV